MSVDLNKLAEKLKKQREMGVAQDGRLTPTNPKNDGSKDKSHTTLEPQRFFVN